MKCPGQDTQFWNPNDVFEIDCGVCGNSIEFFKDDPSRRCRSCGARIANPRFSAGCAQWCEHAVQCLGFDPRTVPADQPNDTSLADRLITAMTEQFAGDQKRVSHALAVLDLAEQILRSEHAQPRVVIAAAILHDIGIHQAQRKFGQSYHDHHEQQGLPIARRIMENIVMDPATIEYVLRIIADHHQSDRLDTPEFKIVWDADLLVNLLEQSNGYDNDELQRIIDTDFKTVAGKNEARKLLLRREP